MGGTGWWKGNLVVRQSVGKECSTRGFQAGSVRTKGMEWKTNGYNVGRVRHVVR